ncbi:MAG: peptidase M16 [Alphaproteobacteria bacterium]|nr:MAG: peptidase M16 [Alphaproteobacteria bacterium]
MPVTQTKLPNGLTVISDTIPHVETVSLGVWVRVGSRNEPESINGAAHFLEHMAFKGTHTRSAQQIAEEVEQVGGYLNAYTSREITAYYARLLKKDLNLGVEILADILQNSTFDPHEMDREREVIIQEIGQTNDTPSDIVYDYFESQCFPDHAIGRSILGPVATVKSMKREDLMGFMKAHYRPEQMVVSAAGNLDHDQLVDQVAKHFSGLKKEGGVEEKIMPTYCGGAFHKVKDLDQLHVLLGFNGCSLRSASYFPMMILSTVLGGGMSSRLFQEVREKKGLAYAVYAFSSSYSDAGVFGVYAGTGQKESQVLINTLFETLGQAQKGMTVQELDRAKNQLKASILMAFESTTSRCRRLATNYLLLGTIYSPQELVSFIDQVSMDEVRLALAHTLKSNLTLATIGPSQDLPAFDQMISMRDQLCKGA